MALDTHQKRIAMMEWDQPWEPGLPDPDGSFSALDRQQLLLGLVNSLWPEVLKVIVIYIKSSINAFTNITSSINKFVIENSIINAILPVKSPINNEINFDSNINTSCIEKSEINIKG